MKHQVCVYQASFSSMSYKPGNQGISAQRHEIFDKVTHISLPPSQAEKEGDMIGVHSVWTFFKT